MPETWYLWQSGPNPAADNMGYDEALLTILPGVGKPVLRFYGWSEPAATFGYSQRHAVVAQLTALRPLIRRPTGGGLVLHETDWTYSLFLPSSDAWYTLTAVAGYQRLHLWIQAAFARLGVETVLSEVTHNDSPGQCFTGAEQLDVLHRNRKIAGAAQRRSRAGLLIQASIQPPPPIAKIDWQKAMCDQAVSDWKVDWAAFEPSTELRELALVLARDKYSSPAYNQRR